MNDYMKFLPLALIAAGLVASATTAQVQIANSADELFDLSESIDENEEGIEQIQRLLIQRQADVAIKLLGVENEQRSQGEDLDQILLLLQQQARANQ